MRTFGLCLLFIALTLNLTLITADLQTGDQGQRSSEVKDIQAPQGQGQDEVKDIPASQGQGQDEVKEPFPPIPSKDLKDLSLKNSRFAFDLFKSLTRSVGQGSSSQGHQNVMVSPFSISMLLSLINLGASGETREELTRKLHHEG